MDVKIGSMTPPATGGTEGPKQLRPLSEQDMKNAAAALQQAMAGGSQKLQDAMKNMPPEVQAAYDKLTPAEKQAMLESPQKQTPEQLHHKLNDALTQMIKKM